MIKGENPTYLMTDGCGNLLCSLNCYHSADYSWPQVNKCTQTCTSTPNHPNYLSVRRECTEMIYFLNHPHYLAFYKKKLAIVLQILDLKG